MGTFLIRMKSLKPKWSFIAAVCLYILLAAVFFRFHRYQISPDGVSYISIAQKYLQGDFSSAINGYWNPLFSWLMIPFLLLGIEPIIAARLSILTVGALAVWGVGILSSKLPIDRELRLVITITSAPLILSYAIFLVGPDALTVCILIYYLAFVVHKDYTKRKRIAILAGAFGAMAYLAKTYNFPFFLAHFTLLNIILYFQKWTTPYRRKKIINSFLLGILTFFLISGIWIFLISQKYEKFTIGTSGKLNFSVYGPRSKGHLHHYKGFMPPPDEKAVSAWDDPSYFSIEKWSPFSSRENFNHQIGIIKNNLNAFPVFYSIGALSFLFFLFFIFNSSKKGFHKDVKGLFIISAIPIYLAGYSLVIVVQRYIWILSILIVLVGGFILSHLFKIKFYAKPIQRAILVAFTLSVLYSPMRFFQNPGNRYRERNIYNVSNVLKKYNIKGKVASSKESWPFSLYLAFYLKVQYYGEPRAEANEDEIKKDLEKLSIDYFIVLQEEHFEFLKDYEELTKKDKFVFKIYDLKK